MTAMNSLNQIIDFSYDSIRWLFTWSWQAMLVLAVGWISLKVDRSRNATSRFRIWLSSIVVVALLPVLDLVFWSRPASVAQTADSLNAQVITSNPSPDVVSQISNHPKWYSYLW